MSAHDERDVGDPTDAAPRDLVPPDVQERMTADEVTALVRTLREEGK